MDFINLSPTDLEKFNKKEDCVEIDQCDEFELCHYKSEESLKTFEKEEKNQQNARKGERINEIARKKSVESEHNLNKNIANKLIKLSTEI
jgi:hypothetical protein